MRRRVIGNGWLLLPLGILLIVAGCSEPEDPTTSGPWPDDPTTPWMEVVVDLTGVRNGRVPVSLTVSGLEFDKGYLKITGEESGYEFFDLRVKDEEDRQVEVERKDRRFRLGPVEGNVLKVEYEAEPGGQARWGHQGILLEDWATFDGRLVLMPKGAEELRAVRIRYGTPDGWQITTPFRRDGDWFYSDTYGPEEAADTLAKSCVGLGNFEEVTRRYGDMEVRVASYRGWSNEYRKELHRKTFSLLDYFHETLGFDSGAPHVVVWLPTHEGGMVYGGAHSNGNCLDNPGNELRDWQLLAHRIAHGMNKYPPSGMRIRDHEDEWFTEGWPCYIEIAATHASGIAEDDAYFNNLYSNYKSNAETQPDIDIALGDGVMGDGVIHMHYRKAPLAVKMLAELMAARSGRTMDEFMRTMWQKYGFFREPFPLKEELEAFTGESFEDFWSVVVRQRGVMAPVTGEFLTPRMRRAVNRAPAARVDGEAVSGDYLHHLARSGDFESYASIREFLIDDLVGRRMLDAHDVRVFPEEIREYLYALPSEQRYAVARIDAAFVEQLKLQGTGSKTGREASRPELDIDEGNPDGGTFSQLIAAEKANNALNTRPATEIGVRIGDDATARTGPARLGFGRDASLLLQADWPSPPGGSEVEVLSGERVTRTWKIAGSATRTRALFAVSPEDRSPGASIVTIRIRNEGTTVARRVFWQRGTEPEQSEAVAMSERSLREAANRDIEAVRADPSNSDNWYRKGLSQTRLGHYRVAEKAFAESLRLDDENPNKWKNHGVSLYELGRYDEAIEALDRAMELYPNFLQARFHKVLALARLGRREECLAELEALLNDVPDSPIRLMWQGQVLAQLGDYLQALVMNRRVVDQLPDRAPGWADLGHTLLKLERYHESVEAYDRALELDPTNHRAEKERDQAFAALLRPDLGVPEPEPARRQR